MSSDFSALLVLMVLKIGAGSSSRPVLTFNPNWDKIFTTESLTMTCNVRSPASSDLNYIWYKDGTRIHTGQNFVIRSASTDNSGNYQCEGTNTGRSDPERLHVSHGWVILQVPLHVHEGDDVTLRCHHYPNYSSGQTIFYKDNSVLRIRGNNEIRIENIKLERSGYKCTKGVYNFRWNQYSGEASIPIKELFTTPEIKVTPFPITEGDNVTVTCHTNVSPYRPDTELQFVFYRDNQILQPFSSSDQYGVQSAQLEDSGKYYCDVKKIGGKIVKRSKDWNIKINEPFTDPEIIMSPNPIQEGDNMTLTCHTKRSPYIPSTDLQFAFYRDGWNIQRNSLFHHYGGQSVKLEDSGNYSCDVGLSGKNITKQSNKLYVQIQELFSQPEIEMVPDLVEEGNQMILICNTTVLTMRNDLELQFAFYKNGQSIQGFNSSHQYEVTSAEIKDSGNYSCEVRTKSVKKRSMEIIVDIQEVRNASNEYDVQPEITYSVLAMHSISQNDSVRTNKNGGNNVVYAAVKPTSRKQSAADPDSIYQNIRS
ncbi:high affinity immunoglobulin gamma Fc receptor I-like isoform X2 [Pyxicephalus adspersus]|uniref:high affinity immunoglobulin gamma Fc receptor I-like isoform X2 n=1 Tax=Pyxicephalus adspersus TaxID=30357 RepID=UPI003B5CD866